MAATTTASSSSTGPPIPPPPQPSTLHLLTTTLHSLSYPSPPYIPLCPSTFNTPTSRQKATESILHFLLSLVHSPQEVAHKLTSTFPLHEPAQSKEFRVNAYKWLSELKKEGRLAVTMVRKSSLEECSGDRWEELVMGVLGMVLRELVASGRLGRERGGRGGLGEVGELILGTSGRAGRGGEVLGWVLRAKVEGLAREREKVRNRYGAVERAISAKEKEYEEARERLGVVDPSAQKSLDSKADLWRRNWTGEERLLEAILFPSSSSGSGASSDDFIKIGFEKLVRLNGNVKTREPFSKELERIARRQDERLERIRSAKSEIVRERRAGSPRKSMARKSMIGVGGGGEQKKEGGVGFGRHKALRPENADARAGRDFEQNENFSILIEALLEDLQTLRHPAPGENPLPSTVISQDAFTREPDESQQRLMEFALSPVKGGYQIQFHAPLGREKELQHREAEQERSLFGELEDPLEVPQPSKMSDSRAEKPQQQQQQQQQQQKKYSFSPVKGLGFDNEDSLLGSETARSSLLAPPLELKPTRRSPSPQNEDLLQSSTPQGSYTFNNTSRSSSISRGRPIHRPSAETTAMESDLLPGNTPLGLTYGTTTSNRSTEQAVSTGTANLSSGKTLAPSIYSTFLPSSSAQQTPTPLPVQQNLPSRVGSGVGKTGTLSRFVSEMDLDEEDLEEFSDLETGDSFYGRSRRGVQQQQQHGDSEEEEEESRQRGMTTQIQAPTPKRATTTAGIRKFAGTIPNLPDFEDTIMTDGDGDISSFAATGADNSLLAAAILQDMNVASSTPSHRNNSNPYFDQHTHQEEEDDEEEGVGNDTLTVPRTPSPQIMRASTPREELLGSVDYDRIFRSRPRVRGSPPW